MSAASPNLWEQIFLHAVRFHESGRADEAGSIFAAIAEHNPNHLPTLQRLAAIRRRQGRWKEALGLLERAVRENPDSAEAHNSLGNTLAGLDRQAEAVEHYRRATALRPEFAEAHFNLGNALKGLERYDEAAAAYGAAISTRPVYAEAHNALGIALDRLNRPEEAIAAYWTALNLDPAIKHGNSNLAASLAELDRHEEAIAFFDRARRLDPDAPEPAFNAALVELAMGDFERGLRDYEARWRVPGLKLNPHEFTKPRWDGTEDIQGKTILLHAEQGLGDTILFLRYAETVAAKGARVILAAQKPLAPLLAGAPGVTQVVAAGEPIPDFDLHLPVGSLPLAFGTTVETIPARTPYLRAHASWNYAGARPAVGLCWAGNPGHRNDHNRSIPMTVFEKLLRVPEMYFVSLQQNLRENDEAALGRYGNVDTSSIGRVKDLGDTASIMSELDLIISVDTAVAHLAGALARPVWVLLPFRPYWVWFRHRGDSPWYPSAHIFRQERIGDWEGVITRVAEELSQLSPAGTRHAGTSGPCQ
jgi:Flp pilus assembly protein TadD